MLGLVGFVCVSANYATRVSEVPLGHCTPNVGTTSQELGGPRLSEAPLGANVGHACSDAPHKDSGRSLTLLLARYAVMLSTRREGLSQMLMSAASKLCLPFPNVLGGAQCGAAPGEYGGARSVSSYVTGVSGKSADPLHLISDVDVRTACLGTLGSGFAPERYHAPRNGLL